MAKGKRTKKAPDHETKAEKFIRLAIPRVTKALKAIRSLANLASSGYESTAEQKAKIVDSLTREINNLGSVYAGEKPGKAEFTF